MKSLNRLVIYRKKLIKPYVDMLLSTLGGLSLIASAIFIVTMVFEYGFIVSEAEHIVINQIYEYTRLLFIISSLSHIILDFEGARSEYGKLAWVMTWLLYLTTIPNIFAEPNSAIFGHLWRILDGGLYQGAVLLALSLLNLSDSVVKLLGRRVNPSFIFALSFLVIILIGAGFLMLPRATYSGIAFIDALFVSTSATCVTGLSTVDVSTVFTPMGITIIMLLIQIGGLGVMTITSFFALFFMGNTSLCNQTLISDMVSSKSLTTLLTTLLYIFGFTVIIELAGAVAIFSDIHTTLGMTLSEEIFFSIFHSISAFCNAGFSTLPDSLGNEMLMSGHNSFYIYISVLVILGGIGFPILVNMYDWAKYTFRRLHTKYIERSFRVERQVHIYDINTKIAVAMTLSLFALSTIAIAIMEWNGAFEGMHLVDKCVQSFFTAVSPRTAGFSSVSMSSFGDQALLLMIFLMVIGGGSQSTAGGIKVNTFTVILLNIRAILQGRETVTVFNRSLSTDSLRRSNSTLVLYILYIFIAVFLLSIFEPEAPLFSILYEAISALSTVGASLDLTPTLGSDSKIVVISLMFIGRVGVFTIIASIIKQKSINSVSYPSGNIIIN